MPIVPYVTGEGQGQGGGGVRGPIEELCLLRSVCFPLINIPQIILRINLIGHTIYKSVLSSYIHPSVASNPAE